MQKRAIEARFPDFVSLFVYDEDGTICGINHHFQYNGYKNSDLIEYILFLANKTEKNNIQRYTDTKCLIEKLTDTLYVYL
jgi:hypothetical protein